MLRRLLEKPIAEETWVRRKRIGHSPGEIHASDLFFEELTAVDTGSISINSGGKGFRSGCRVFASVT